MKPLFDQFGEYLNEKGFQASGGQLIDATIVEVPVQHNSKEETAQIKNGQTPEKWSEAKTEQKDTDARWTKKGEQKLLWI